jgi:predicted amidohydrolase
VRPGGASLGGLICWEHWMPLARQALHDEGEEIHVASWSAVKELHLLASRHYAFEGRCFVIAVGSILRVRDLPPELPPAPDLAAQPDALLLAGGSAILGPDGGILAGPVLGEEALVVADCDPRAIAREALTLDVSGHYGRRDVLRLEIDRRRPS